MRRRQATAESRARAERIARALAGLLDDVPVPAVAADADADADAAGARPAVPGQRLACPRCGGEMQAVGAGQGVEVDQCLECGAVWLDAGELDEIVAGREPGPEAPVPSMVELRGRMRELVPRGEVAVKYRDCPRC